MNKIIYTVLTALMVIAALSSCSDFLDKEPKTELSPNTFWKTESDLRFGLNSLYANMNRSYTIDNQSIDCFAAIGNPVSSGTYTASNTDGIWTTAYNNIRVVCDFLENYDKAEVSDAVKARYRGEALFFKAYFYFNLIKRFGDVPYADHTLDLASEELYGPRIDKRQILDIILADLAEAEAAVPHKSAMKNDLGRITKGAIQALTARIALYFGTWYKYHGGADGTQYLAIARDAARRLMDSNEYSIYPDYRNLFLLPGEDSSEHILSFRYSDETSSYNARIRGVIVDFIQDPTKHLADAFLCKDGLPIGKSAYTVDYLPLGKEFDNRDPRMALTIWRPGDQFRNEAFLPNLANQTKTGYMFKKYGDEDSYANIQSKIDEILIRYAEVLITYAEATYELDGSISDADLDISVNTIRDRFAGNPDCLPHLTNAFATAHGLDMLEEIRRERRVELCSESLRYDDLIRWKTAEHELPQSILGAKFDAGSYPALTTGKDIILNADGFILVQDGNSRTFDPAKDYLFPLPLREVRLNPQLTQNPGW